LFAALAVLASSACVTPRQDASSTAVTVVAFSDYHSHAVPFYSEGKPGQGGIARAVAYFDAARRRGDTVVVSGGDMMNAGSPTWSDEYRCAEWPWLNGRVEVMALGNHDLDHGAETLAQCRTQLTYPVLCGNLRGEDGAPLLTVEGKPYWVQRVAGKRIGFFALAGGDFQRLVKPERLPPGAHFADALTEAKAEVKALREVEKVDAVIFIGHEHRDDDEAMARAVPGIDLILGTHSHHRSELRRIEGTQTFFISPYQYLTYVSEVRLVFVPGQPLQVTGGLVRLDETWPEDEALRAQVGRMQAALEAKHPERFQTVGVAAVALSDANVSSGESLIGNWATGAWREATQAHVFTTTASSFRASLPPGEITLESLYGAIPYKNALVTAQVTGDQLRAWVAYSVSKKGADGFSPQSGVRYTLRDGKLEGLSVLKDAAHPEAGYVQVDAQAVYRLATTDFQAYVASGYKELFATFAQVKKTGLDAHEVLLQALKQRPATAAYDGRTREP